MLNDYVKALGDVKGKVDSVLDLGCGFGGITLLTQGYFGASRVYGVDRTEATLAKAKARGVQTMCLNLDHEPVPLDDSQLDLVVCNGVIEHLSFYDNAITEAHRLLKSNGYLVISMPNLGNYIQRISLLLGYQPSDVSVSHVVQVGTIFGAGWDSVGHAHSATMRAMKQLLPYYGFDIVSIRKGRPRLIGPFHKWALPIKVLGYILPKSFVRRLIFVSRKRV